MCGVHQNTPGPNPAITPQSAAAQDVPLHEVMTAAETLGDTVSVQTALDSMTRRGVVSSSVIGDAGELLGSISQEEMNRTVGGLGHDPDSVAVSEHVQTGGAFCFVDETVGQAQEAMRTANVADLPVVDRDNVVQGTASLIGIEANKLRVELPPTLS